MVCLCCGPRSCPVQGVERGLAQCHFPHLPQPPRQPLPLPQRCPLWVWIPHKCLSMPLLCWRLWWTCKPQLWLAPLRTALCRLRWLQLPKAWRTMVQRRHSRSCLHLFAWQWLLHGLRPCFHWHWLQHAL